MWRVAILELGDLSHQAARIGHGRREECTRIQGEEVLHTLGAKAKNNHTPILDLLMINGFAPMTLGFADTNFNVRSCQQGAARSWGLRLLPPSCHHLEAENGEARVPSRSHVLPLSGRLLVMSCHIDHHRRSILPVCHTPTQCQLTQSTRKMAKQDSFQYLLGLKYYPNDIWCVHLAR